MVERIVFDAVLFCCGDILGKGIELAFQRSAMLGEDIEQRRQCRITEFSAYRFRRSRIVHIESNLIMPLRSHAILAFWSHPICPFPIARRLSHEQVRHTWGRALRQPGRQPKPSPSFLLSIHYCIMLSSSTREGKQVATIAEWLASLGISEYAQRFTENDIDTSVLRHLTDQDLKELGISVGHRRKMLAAIAELAATPSATAFQPEPRDDAERRQITIMFCDLVGSTALSTRL